MACLSFLKVEKNSTHQNVSEMFSSNCHSTKSTVVNEIKLFAKRVKHAWTTSLTKGVKHPWTASKTVQ